MDSSIACLIVMMVGSLSACCKGRSGGHVNENSGDCNCGNCGCDASSFGNFNCPLIWGSTEDGDIVFESLTSKTLDGALNIVRNSYFPDENICKGCDLLSERGASEEVEQLALDIVKDGITIVARNAFTNEVVGTIFNKLLKPKTGNEKSELEIYRDSFEHNASKCYADVYFNIRSRADIYKRYDADCIMEMTFLAVRQDYRRRGIAGLLVSSSLELGRQLYKGIPVKTSVDIDGKSITNADDIPSIAVTIMTSEYAQKLLDKFEFDKLVEVSFNALTFEGIPLSEKIGDVHQTAILGVKSLSPY
ncbi:uncharacterized protein LOC130664082 [Microplitis mediator]|uniref:uncharacterized protein LOC130664082 n=1 Tax=Microplitis mediator TaxID=375433 RepID=UPI002553B3C1|nr:uncharacterized protein LOC130664082 [Microplitis mediator]